MSSTTPTAPKSLADTLHRARAMADQRAAAERDAFARLVTDTARGKDVTPEAIVSSLAKWGRTVEEFQIAVELAAKRLLLRSEHEQLDTLNARLAAAEDKLRYAAATLEAEVAAAQAKHIETALPIESEVSIVRAALNRCETARNELLKTAPAERIETVHVAQSRLAGATKEIDRLRGIAEKLRTNDIPLAEKTHATLLEHNPIRHLDAEGRQQEYWMTNHRKDVANSSATVARLKAMLADIEERELPAALAEAEAARAELEAAHAALLLP